MQLQALEYCKLNWIHYLHSYHHLGYNYFMLYTILLNIQKHMATRTTTVNHSDLPCTCTSRDQYVDGLCPGCIEAADRDADLKEHLDAQNECIYPQPTGNWEMPFLREDGD